MSQNSIKSFNKLSSLQFGMLFESMEDKKLFVNQLLIKNIYNEDCIREAIKILGMNHPFLTCNILYEKVSEPRIVFFENRSIFFQKINCKNTSEMNDILNDELNCFGSIQRDSLFRVKIVTTEDNKTYLIWTYHHIILDGWSVDLLFKEFIDIWHSLIQGHEYECEKNQEIDDYREFISRIENLDKVEHIKYWKNVLSGFDNYNILPFMKRKNGKINSSNSCTYVYDDGIVSKLVSLAHKFNITVSNILETVWGLVLAEYSTENDIVFGKVVSIRNMLPNRMDNQIGFYINTIPVRINFDVNDKIIDIIKMTAENAANSANYCYCSLIDIQNEIKHNHLINTSYSFENYSVEINNDDPKIITYDEINESTDCPLNIFISIKNNQLKIKLLFEKDLYSKEEIDYIYNKYICILSTITDNFDKKIKDLDFITDEEKKKLASFNLTEKNYDLDKTVIELFEQQAEKNPNKIAMTFLGQELTYGQFNKKANQLAHNLRERYNIHANDLVPIITERSFEMVIGIYAILKAGAAYVPIDPSYPDERISYIIDDCEAKVVLVFNTVVKTEKIVLDMAEPDSYSKDDSNLSKIATPDSIIYCIYTSGTTGQPKGVMNVNKGLTNMINWIQDKYPIDQDDTILLKTTYTFDVSFWELVWWGTVGAKLDILPPNAERDPNLIADEIEKNNISVITFVPSMLNAFLSTIKTQNRCVDCSDMKYILIIGEPLSNNTVNNAFELLFEKGSDVKIVNTYGPTEASIAVTSFECNYNEKRILIGKPISNTNIYIMKNNHLCGIGVPGELCILGAALAKGYLKRKQLTKEKFVECSIDGKKMYCSGDLAFWMPDGNIFFLGRVDDQVKIRGCRVELSEIENRIREIEYIDDCTIVSHNGKFGEKEVYAYVVGEDKIVIDDVKKLLKKSLPDYMIPNFFLQIDNIPTMKNGKVNRRLLPEIISDQMEDYIAPRNEIEAEVEKAFCSVLNISKCSINNSFFDLGGDSLKCIGLLNEMNEKFNIQIAVGDVFSNSTVAELSKVVEKKHQIGRSMIIKAETKDSYCMSSAQKRMFMLYQMDKESVAYNTPQMFKIKGKINKIKLKDSLIKIVDKHEILRTSFVMRDDELLQIISANADVDFEYLDEGEKTDKEYFEEFVRPFKLEKAPLFRIKLVQYDDHAILYIDSHHIITDGTAMKGFMNEIFSFYNAE